MSESIMNLIADLSVLREWAPEVLQRRDRASADDLKEIITLRSKVKKALDELPKEKKGGWFFQALRVDQVCTEDLYTLLYLTREEAEEAAEAVGCPLNQLAWYGVHDWAVSDVLDNWTSSINQETDTDFHQAEVLRAYDEYARVRGRKYMNEQFFNDTGEFIELPEPQDRRALWKLAHLSRKSEN